jgi:hypothetical protein
MSAHLNVAGEKANLNKREIDLPRRVLVGGDIADKRTVRHACGFRPAHRVDRYFQATKGCAHL